MARLRIGGLSVGNVPAATSSYKSASLGTSRRGTVRVSVGTTQIGRTSVRVS
jgi:hypothetical protein